MLDKYAPWSSWSNFGAWTLGLGMVGGAAVGTVYVYRRSQFTNDHTQEFFEHVVESANKPVDTVSVSPTTDVSTDVTTVTSEIMDIKRVNRPLFGSDRDLQQEGEECEEEESNEEA